MALGVNVVPPPSSTQRPQTSTGFNLDEFLARNFNLGGLFDQDPRTGFIGVGSDVGFLGTGLGGFQPQTRQDPNRPTFDPIRPAVEGSLDLTEQILRAGRDFNKGPLEGSQGRLDDLSVLLEEILGGRISDIERAPLNPFTQEQFDVQKNLIFSTIQDEIQSAQQQSAINLNARGAARGSQAFQQFGELQGVGTQAKAGALGELLGRRDEAARRSEEFRQALINPIELAQAGFEQRIGEIRTALEAGEIVRPGEFADFVGELTALDLGEQDREMLFDWLEDFQANQQTGGELDLLGAALQIAFPSAQNVVAGGQTLLTALQPQTSGVN